MPTLSVTEQGFYMMLLTSKYDGVRIRTGDIYVQNAYMIQAPISVSNPFIGLTRFNILAPHKCVQASFMPFHLLLFVPDTLVLSLAMGNFILESSCPAVVLELP
jgi:hypothetical protein